MDKYCSFDMMAEISSIKYEQLTSKEIQVKAFEPESLPERSKLEADIKSLKEKFDFTQTPDISRLTERFSKRIKYNYCGDAYRCIMFPVRCNAFYDSINEESPLKAVYNHLLQHVEEIQGKLEGCSYDHLDLFNLTQLYMGMKDYYEFLQCERRAKKRKCYESFIKLHPEPAFPFLSYPPLLPAKTSISSSHDHSYSMNVCDTKKSNSNVGGYSELTIDEEDDVPSAKNGSSVCWPPPGCSFSIKPQFAYPSCPFPGVHDPMANLEVGQIEEVTADCISVKRCVEKSCQCHVGCDGKWNAEKCLLKISDPSIKRDSRSVLGCMENQEKLQARVRRKPKRFTIDDDSNSENVQKALESISRLSTNSKTRIAGPHICDVCTKKFSVKSSLMNHLKSHARIKEHLCHMCNSRFSRRTGLEYHLMVHRKQVKFTCPKCSKMFRHKNHFQEHVMNHNAPFKCKLCGSVFVKWKPFRTHMHNEHKQIVTTSANGIQIEK